MYKYRWTGVVSTFIPNTNQRNPKETPKKKIPTRASVPFFFFLFFFSPPAAAARRRRKSFRLVGYNVIA